MPTNSTPWTPHNGLELRDAAAARCEPLPSGQRDPLRPKTDAPHCPARREPRTEDPRVLNEHEWESYGRENYQQYIEQVRW